MITILNTVDQPICLSLFCHYLQQTFVHTIQIVTNQAKAAEAAERAAFCRGELDEVVDHKKIVFKIYEIYERRW